MRIHQLYIIALAGAMILAAAGSGAEERLPTEWNVVVNNGDAIPGHPDRTYNSYNPPSVNGNAFVVFRARSTGRQRGPVSGIYGRDMGTDGSAIRLIADRDTPVPDPNNTAYPAGGGDHAGGGHDAGNGVGDDQGGPDWRLATFNEFPSIPRIAPGRDAVATRGNHPPVWTWGSSDDELRAGTTGVYFAPAADEAAAALHTGASLLGEVGQSDYADFSYLFAVPGVVPTVRFDVFPGSPSITDDGHIAFKGNYTDPMTGAGKTGVYYRRVVADYAGGPQPVERVADSDTVIPNHRHCRRDITFGSTAPPSAADGNVVFVGYDDEEDPSCGGIYRARFTNPEEDLTTLVGLDTAVPLGGAGLFRRIGEGLSYDGRFVAFWAAWGEAMRTLKLYCPEEGNRIRRDYCNHAGDFADGPEGQIEGDAWSICEDAAGNPLARCYQLKQVPVNQGLFVLDTLSRRLRLVARAGVDADYDDFLYWNYSGAPPGAGESEGYGEPPRFRSAAFLSVSARAGATFRLAFLARTADADAAGVYRDPVDGIYLAEALGASGISTAALLRTGWDGTVLDPLAIDPATGEALPISSLALEREGFRRGWLAVAAGMGTEDAGWAGIYLADLRDERPLP
jgi:hypothetical protein